MVSVNGFVSMTFFPPLSNFRPVRVFRQDKGTKAFSSWKGPLRGNSKSLLEHFKGIKARTRGHEGNRLIYFREV